MDLDGRVEADAKAIGKTVTITATAADGTNKSASIKLKIVAPEVPVATTAPAAEA